MKILFDTNVILDVMILRPPFYKASALLLAEVEKKNLDGYLCPTTVTTLYYLTKKVKGKNTATGQIGNLLKIFKVSVVDKSCLESAMFSQIQDYEDAVLHESALREGIEGIVTRNIKDFRKAQIPVYDPDELLKILNH